MNWSVMNVVCYERGLLLMGLLWTGLLRTWSVLNGLFWAVCYEQVCFERSPFETVTRVLNFHGFSMLIWPLIQTTHCKRFDTSC